jgi:hypothetical protein
MHVALGHHTGKGGSDTQVSFNVRDGRERLPRRLDVLLRGGDLPLIGLDCLLGQDDIVAGDDARCGRCRFQLVERARVGFCSIGPAPS